MKTDRIEYQILTDALQRRRERIELQAQQEEQVKARLAAALEEGEEQARLLGMSGEREAGLLAEVDRLKRERDGARELLEGLTRWKRETLVIESSWDPQAVGKLLGLTLGTEIHPKIEPGIRRLIEQRDRLATLICDPAIREAIEHRAQSEKGQAATDQAHVEACEQSENPEIRMRAAVFRERQNNHLEAARRYTAALESLIAAIEGKEQG